MIIQQAEMTAVPTVDPGGEEIITIHVQHADMNTVPTVDPGGEEIMII